MTAIDSEIFDDLLIGNFMKTTLHQMGSLYEGDFNFAVTKFGDNGQVKTHREVDAYLKEYKCRAGADWYYHRLYENLIDRVRSTAIAYLPRAWPTRFTACWQRRRTNPLADRGSAGRIGAQAQFKSAIQRFAASCDHRSGRSKRIGAAFCDGRSGRASPGLPRCFSSKAR
jgi:hypothetical protein